MNLTSPAPFWLIRNGLTSIYPGIEHDEVCDFAVVGAGITGALIASRLSSLGFNVVVVDRRHACTGSTSASTALIQYDVDIPLVELAKMRGRQFAQKAYAMCHDAIDFLDLLADRVKGLIGYQRATSLYLARDRQSALRVAQEFRARKRLSLDVQYHTQSDLKSNFHIDGEAALSTRQAASCDPYKFAHALLNETLSHGGRVYDHTQVNAYQPIEQGIRLVTDRGPIIQAKQAIIAAGFEASKMIQHPIVQLDNTYALVSEPLRDVSPWNKDWMLWEAQDPYLYLRITSDNRLLAGGEDDQFYNPTHRDKSVDQKSQIIREKVQRLLPELKWETAFAWAGTFGKTKDGLPYIGRVPQHPNCYFALGFGGNGMTFGAIATQMVEAMAKGQTHPGEQLFGFDR